MFILVLMALEAIVKIRSEAFELKIEGFEKGLR